MERPVAVLLEPPAAPSSRYAFTHPEARPREPKEIWLVPESGHTGGIEAQPAEYEHAGIRSIRESLAIPGTRMRIEAALAHAIVTPAAALFSNTLPPASLEELSGRIAPPPTFFIYAVPGQGGEAELTEIYFDAARAGACSPGHCRAPPGPATRGRVAAKTEIRAATSLPPRAGSWCR